MSAAIRDPHRLMLFALALLIHVALFQLLRMSRPVRIESPERSTELVFWRALRTNPPPPPEFSRLPVPQLQNTSPPASTAPQLIAPPEPADTGAAPSIDWRRDGEQVARDHALTAEAARDRKDDHAAPKPKPQIAWSHSRTHRIDPMENGGFVVWINDKCGVAVSLMAMPFCQFGKKPARGDLFEHMDAPPTAGDWKDE